MFISFGFISAPLAPKLNGLLDGENIKFSEKKKVSKRVIWVPEVHPSPPLTFRQRLCNFKNLNMNFLTVKISNGLIFNKEVLVYGKKSLQT